MSNKKLKTITDIINEKRTIAREIRSETPNQYGRELAVMLEAEADRIEAAFKHSVTNCNRLGNAAKMREALEIAEYVLCAKGLFNVSKQMTAALSAPPRNCDRPECATTKEAQEVWRREDGGKTAYYEWLLAISTKGEAE